MKRGSRRTKIVATVGPASWSADKLAELLEQGVDVFRVNLAHTNVAMLEGIVARIRSASASAGRAAGILVDLAGPKMRCGDVGPDVVLEEGRPFTLTAADVVGDHDRVSTTVDDLPALVEAGDPVFLDDGAIALEVTGVDGGDVTTVVRRGGHLRSRRGMHLPSIERRVDAFTPEDAPALDSVIHLEVDFVGVSFVRDGSDIERVAKAVRAGPQPPLVVAKIETRAAVDNLEGIVHAADAVMVARGDLGIQMPLKRVPLLQKDIVHLCNCAGKPVITATEMLESMTHEPLPTRAEVTDVANAVLDGTDALMLSGETAIGDRPAEVVAAMAEIAAVADARVRPEYRDPLEQLADEADAVSWAVARSAVQAAEELNAAAILCPTRTGATARRVAAFRPRMPILGLAHAEPTARRLCLSWGVVPHLAEFLPEGRVATEAIARAVSVAVETGLAARGDLVVVVAGGPEPRAGSTDLVRVVRA